MDVRGVSDAELVGLVRSLEAQQRSLDAFRSVVLAELDARDEPQRRTGLRTPGWLGAEFGLPRDEAHRRVGVARKLRTDLPVVADALASGRISFAHAALLCRLANPRVRDLVAAMQQEFIDLSIGVRFEQWAREVRALIDLADTDGGHDPRPEDNHLALSDGLNGDLHLDATLVGDHAATVRAALSDETERQWRRHRDLRAADPGHPLPTRGQLMAEALTELIRRGTATRPNVPAPVTDVTLVIHASEPLDARTPDGVRLADGTTRHLLCDAAIHALIVDSLGVPLDLGTTIRYATQEQRRAARIRDGGCIHPGCDAPATWTHLHHCHHASHGGPTDLHNLASGCPQHHALWHRTDWDIQPNPNQPGRFLITTPDGRQLHSQQHGRTRQ
ncbi:MAG: DUF222 domain-containing protein [Acidobacteria bacterium]|nr:DUF222 domain-containing protein [Acidobacteriota bacterium]